MNEKKKLAYRKASVAHTSVKIKNRPGVCLSIAHTDPVQANRAWLHISPQIIYPLASTFFDENTLYEVSRPLALSRGGLPVR